MSIPRISVHKLHTVYILRLSHATSTPLTFTIHASACRENARLKHLLLNKVYKRTHMLGPAHLNASTQECYCVLRATSVLRMAPFASCFLPESFSANLPTTPRLLSTVLTFTAVLSIKKDGNHEPRIVSGEVESRQWPEECRVADFGGESKKSIWRLDEDPPWMLQWHPVEFRARII